MDCKFAVCLLRVLVFLIVASISLASAAELKLTGELHYNSVSVTLQNTAGHDVSYTLKFQLKQKSGSEWKLLDTLNCSVNSSIAASATKAFNCSYTAPNAAGQYKIFARATIVNGTYTYKDFPFDVGAAGFKEPEPKEDVIVRLVSAPDKVKTGEKFSVVVNITSNKKTLLEVYSYTYDGKKCFSLSGWQGNSEKYSFEKGQNMAFNLSDSVVHEAPNGTYKIKVRARDAAAGKDYDLTKDIEVEQTPPDLFKEIPKTENPKPKTESSGLSVGLLLPLIGCIPLVFLLVKKML